MTKPIFSAHPHMLGFERVEALAQAAARGAASGYPPFNIESLGERRFRITLAVAGFAPADLDVTIEGGQLMVRGRQPEEAGERAFIHRGIASRAFERGFVLADGVEVAEARLSSGLLHVDLERREPEQVVTRIEIRSGERGRA